MSALIKLSQASYSYKGVDALANITLSIQAGESIAIIGTNGCGKSTFLKLLNGIVFPRSGTYHFDDSPITPALLNDARFRKTFHQRVGFVFQNSETQLFCSNVYDEVAFGPRQMNLDETAIQTRVDDCLNLLGIIRLKHREPFHLSEGEKKKVAIAAVLSLNPDVLILDEPMNGLDPRTKRFLRELLLDLNRSGKTIICATHDFEYVEGIFKRVVAFAEDHTLARDGNYQDVIADTDFLLKHNLK